MTRPADTDTTTRGARAPLAALAAGLLAALLLAACTTDDEPPPATEMPTVTATPTATPSATASPRPPAGGEAVPTLEVSSQLRFTSRAVAPGDAVDVEHGAFIADPESGAGELWQLDVVPEPGDWFTYEWSGGGRFLSVLHTRVQRGYLVDRSTGTTFEWRHQQLTRVAGPSADGLVVFRAREPGCQFFVVRLGPTAITTSVAVDDADSDRSCGPGAAAVAEDGGAALVVDRGHIHLVAVDENDRGSVDVLDQEVASNSRPHAHPEGFTVLGATGARDAPPTVIVSAYTPNGEAVKSLSLCGGHQGNEVRYLTASPDGRYIAWQQDLPFGVPSGAGGREHWPSVVIADVERGEVLLRAVRASLTNGMTRLRWLADSSGIVVATEDGFAVLSVDGKVDLMPFAPVGHFDPVPIPSPREEGVYLYGGKVVDAQGVEVGEAAAPALQWGPNWGSASRYGWTDDGRAVVFWRSPPPGRDFGPGGLSGLGLPPRVERPPFSNALLVETSEPLDIRSAPEGAAGVVASMPGGSRLTVVNDDRAEQYCNGTAACSIAYDAGQPDVLWWLHVRSEAGIEGWVQPRDLEWAD